VLTARENGLAQGQGRDPELRTEPSHLKATIPKMVTANSERLQNFYHRRLKMSAPSQGTGVEGKGMGEVVATFTIYSPLGIQRVLSSSWEANKDRLGKWPLHGGGAHRGVWVNRK